MRIQESSGSHTSRGLLLKARCIRARLRYLPTQHVRQDRTEGSSDQVCRRRRP
jgi:hypothetical protein